MGTTRLETKRLILRQLIPADAPQMLQNWAADPAVTKYLTWPAYQDVDQVKARLTQQAQHYQEPDFFDWGIELKASGELIGTISVVNAYPKLHTLEVGYAIGQPYWHHGYSTEAFKEVIAYLFASTDVNRIEAKHDTANTFSGKVMQKSGLTFEGVLRQRGLNNTGLVDEAMYAILRSTFEDTSH
ncbi:MAG: GNAT family N-acetyltransferase [Lactobacillus sp.]|jgi:RimJ/RimL family protein N-acetyltransferase|nr:GNAT family N-acetyltransferase [Lactobacillus sp.]